MKHWPHQDLGTCFGSLWKQVTFLTSLSAGCCNFFKGWMLQQTDPSKDQTGWSASVTAVSTYMYPILFYSILCETAFLTMATKLWWLCLYQLLEIMLNGGATAEHRVKHAFLHQLSGWYSTLQTAHSYFSQFSKSVFMVALHLIIHEMSSSLGSLFGLGMVSHVSTHLLQTALRLNNCWYRPQTKHSSLYALQSCADDIQCCNTPI